MSLKPIANAYNWWWAGTSCSKSVSVNEETIATRILTDIALVTLNYEILLRIYKSRPGLVADKLKEMLEFSWFLHTSRGNKRFSICLR